MRPSTWSEWTGRAKSSPSHWTAAIVGVVAGLTGSYVLGDAERPPDPFDRLPPGDRPR